MELSATAKVILGVLAWRPRSGYEIKQLVDSSTRFFWAASYGQIYPELKRLAEAGLIEGTDAAQGNRARTVHRLTPKGKRALRAWLEEPPEVFEMRDEGMLKVFFSSSGKPGQPAEAARQRAAHSERIAAQLREIERAAPGTDGPSYSVLRYGIELNEWISQWWEAAAAQIEKPPGKPGAQTVTATRRS